MLECWAWVYPVPFRKVGLWLWENGKKGLTNGTEGTDVWVCGYSDAIPVSLSVCLSVHLPACLPYRDLGLGNGMTSQLASDNDRVFDDLWRKDNNMPMVLNNPYSESDKVASPSACVSEHLSSLSGCCVCVLCCLVLYGDELCCVTFQFVPPFSFLILCLWPNKGSECPLKAWQHVF